MSRKPTTCIIRPHARHKTLLKSPISWPHPPPADRNRHQLTATVTQTQAHVPTIHTYRTSPNHEQEIICCEIYVYPPPPIFSFNAAYLERGGGTHLDQLHNPLLVRGEAGDLTDDLANELDTGGLLSLVEDSTRTLSTGRGHVTLVQAHADTSLCRPSHFHLLYFPA